ncbi:MAG: hypothetical protein JSV99_03515 [Planctomycetota bacterium]|nr:MAG: hypothetical protein JSV99_03515 [Planctomycetota bacterium]
MNNDWKWYHSFGLLALIVVTCLVGWLIPASQIQLTWLLSLVALTMFTMLTSHGITGRFWLGWLINEQYRMSLSRLQMFLWTVVVVSAFFTSVLTNIKAGHLENALDITIQKELWIAMGISTISLVGSPLINSQKKRKKTNKKEAEKTLTRLGLLAEGANEVEKEVVTAKHYSGQLHRNENPQDARLFDMVRGEETSNADVLDLTRLQNLFFTLILIGTYAVNLGSKLVADAGEICKSPIDKFPELGVSSIALLAISHAGYLVGKAVDHQPEG